MKNIQFQKKEVKTDIFDEVLVYWRFEVIKNVKYNFTSHNECIILSVWRIFKMGDKHCQYMSDHVGSIHVRVCAVKIDLDSRFHSPSTYCRANPLKIQMITSHPKLSKITNDKINGKMLKNIFVNEILLWKKKVVETGFHSRRIKII